MGISTKLITAIDSIIYAFKSGVKTDLKDYSDLETVLNPTTIVAKDGSMATIYEIYGATKFIGDSELREIEESLFSTLTSSLQKEGHQLQFVFSKDKDRIKNHIRETLEPYKSAAKNLNLNMDDMFDSKVEHLSKYCAFESCFLVAWSKPELIKETLKDQQQENADRAAKAPLFIDAQNIILEYDRLESTHIAFCDVISSAFSKAGINIEKLHVRKAIKEIRRSVSHRYTSPEWEPSLPMLVSEYNDKEGIKLPLKDSKRMRRSENDVSDLLWPSLSEQIFPVDVDVVDSGTIKMGDKYVSSMYIDIPPQNVSPFKSLIDSIDNDIPIQLSFTLESGGLNKAKLKAMAASVLAVTNSGNKMVRDSINYLRQQELEGESIIKMSINAITFAEDEKELSIRKQVVLKKLQNWGNAQVVFNTVDPIEGVLSTSPALTYKPSANPSLAPLIDVIKMLPLSRQSHVWRTGSVLFRTYDGKLFPFQPGSSMQNTWNDLIFAIPGSGKSVLMNSMNLAAVIQPGSKALPLIGIIDIGPSSSGLIQLIRDALPENQKHLAVYKRIQNTPDYAINVFDTHLGCREPAPSDYSFLQNFLTLIMTPAGRKEPYASTDSMVIKIVKKAFEFYSDGADSSPKKYHFGTDALVDQKLKDYNIDAEEMDMSWWAVVDALFEKNEIRMAGRAQRYAVPVLEELVSIANSSPAIKDAYKKPTIETGENMIDLFARSISEAVQQYPMLNLPTQFDISDSRIISLDLDEVAKGSDPASVKQTGIMYMLARSVVGKKFKISKDEMLKAAPKKYLEHHLKIASEMRETRKRLCMDEFHRTKGITSVRNQVVTDQREGRKWNLQVVLASQMIDDFDEDMRGLSTGSFVMSGGSDTYEKLTEIFKFNKTTSQIAKMQLNGPTSDGVPFIYNCKTKTGDYSQLLYSTISPVELWAFNTTAEDVALRDKLVEEIGSASEARRILSETFKKGSAKKNIETIQETSKDPEIARDPYSYLIRIMKERNNLI